MFAGQSYQGSQSTGKRVYGFQTRKEPAFSLGWDESNQLNSFQLKKGKGKQPTGKITGKSLQQPKNEEFYDEALEMQKLQQLYEKLAYQNPDIPPEQLQKYVFEQRSQKKISNQNQTPTKRAPVLQKESMKDIMYGGNQPKSMEQKRAQSRRNNSNLVLGDGYNYFHHQRR